MVFDLDISCANNRTLSVVISVDKKLQKFVSSSKKEISCLLLVKLSSFFVSNLNSENPENPNFWQSRMIEVPEEWSSTASCVRLLSKSSGWLSSFNNMDCSVLESCVL